LRKIIHILYSIWVGFWFIAWMLLLSPFIGIPLFFANGFKWSYHVMRFWVKMLILFTGIRFRVSGRENLAGGKPCIYIINHTSYMDAPAIPAIVPEPLKALGKKELSKVPVFGQLVSGFAVWVDRKNAESRKKSLEGIRKVLLGGTPIIIAPEGTRSYPGEGLLPFKDGAFRLAVETQIPVRPILIHGASALMPRGTFLVKPGRINAEILPPVPLLAGDDVESYKQRVRSTMEEGLVNDPHYHPPLMK
jgi:1-acyl-sn-glycerol-3-phosphate acyltransferase